MADEPIIDMTKVSDKGQVVIPKEIRDKLKFTEGSKLLVIATEDAVILQRIESVAGQDARQGHHGKGPLDCEQD